MTFFAAVNSTALAAFGVVVAITLLITYWASKRTKTATDFWAAGRGITSAQNGLAIAGDYMSAASFLGIGGLIFLFGFDGFLYAVGFIVAFLTVLFLLAERMRNSGKYTMADTLAFRLNERPARAAAALGTLSVVAFYLIAQMVGAGVLIQALVGIDFSLAVIITGAFMLCYVVFGGMLATTWVQIVKAVLMLSTGLVLTILVLNRIGWNPIDLFNKAVDKSPKGHKFLEPGLRFSNPIDTVSLGLALVLGTAGLPHILMRFFTVPNAKAARSSVLWATGLIGSFYLVTVVSGPGRPSHPRHPGRGRRRQGRQPGGAGPGPGAGRRAGHDRGRPGPGHRGRSGLCHDSRGRRRAGDLRLGGVGPRRLVEHRAQGTRLRARGGLGGQDRGVRHRRRRHRRGHPGWRRPERLVHGGPGLRRGGVGQLPRVAAGADLEAVQHRRGSDRRAGRGHQLGRADRPEPHRVAWARRAGLAGQPGEPGDHLDPAGLPGLLAGHHAEPPRGEARAAPSRNSSSARRRAWAPRWASNGHRPDTRPRVPRRREPAVPAGSR